MRKSKKFLVTSVAATTLALVSFSDTMGVLPFSPQKVSAQEKDASKNGKVVKENTTSASNQAEKSKTPAQNPAEKPKTPAPKPEPKPARQSQRRNQLRNRKHQLKNLLRNLKIQVLKRISPNLQLSLVG